MDRMISRRRFLARGWRWGVAFLGAAGIWTSWDLLQPGPSSGFGGKIRTVRPDVVPERGVLEIPAARAYLTKVDGDFTALWWKCTHLGCRVPWCDSASEFECPCHGSVFNRAGEFRAGPAPRGLDRFAVEVVDGFIVIDTASVLLGPPPGPESIDEPPTGPRCLDLGGES